MPSCSTSRPKATAEHTLNSQVDKCARRVQARLIQPVNKTLQNLHGRAAVRCICLCESVDPNMPNDILETTFHVRYAETDQMGIVHHAAYIIWMEEGRSDFMRRKNVDYAKVEQRGLSLAVTDLNVRYVASAHYGEQVTVRTWVDSLRSRMLVFDYEIVNAETKQKLITGSVKLILIDQQGQVVTIPEEIQAALRPTA